MHYEIIINYEGKRENVKIFPAVYQNRRVWTIDLPDKQCILYRENGRWLQTDADLLDENLVNLLGGAIEQISDYAELNRGDYA